MKLIQPITKSFKVFFIITSFWFIPAVTNALHAQEVPTNLHQQSDFYLRIIYGVGLSEGRLTEAGQQEIIKDGVSGYYALQLGYTIIDNLILYTETGVSAAASPSAYLNDVKLQKRITRYSVPAFGLGATYYFMPLNIHVSLQARIPELHYYIHQSALYISSLGLGFGASVGMEWPFDQYWGVGAALHFLYDMPGLFKSDQYTARENLYGGLSVTVTYN